jgi:ABC-2 type transport system ATP-binding protein
MSDEGTVIRVSGLSKRYGPVVALDGLSFSVARGEVFGVIGPNGAGKTTLVECLLGLRRAERGTVEVLGLDPWRDARALRQRTGAQLQDSSLPDDIRVGEALALFASFYAPRRDWRPLLAHWGLGDKRTARFASLSGGLRHRLFVALALVNDPEVVFLDELTSGLDPQARRGAWRSISRLRERGTTVVLVTHFMEEAERLCDRVLVLDGGRLLALDTPRGLVASLGAEGRRPGCASLEDYYVSAIGEANR